MQLDERQVDETVNKSHVEERTALKPNADESSAMFIDDGNNTLNATNQKLILNPIDENDWMRNNAAKSVIEETPMSLNLKHLKHRITNRSIQINQFII